MPIKLSVQKLNDKRRLRCLSTISPYAFYMLVADALMRRESLSVIRMGDGERLLLENAKEGFPGDEIVPFGGLNTTWMMRQGCLGISKGELIRRLFLAAAHCTYFAPNVMGVHYPIWDLSSHFGDRGVYVDNWFVRIWNDEMIANLYQEAKHVVFIHGYAPAGKAMSYACEPMGVKVTFIQHSSWEQSDDVISAAIATDAPLVIFSAGPAAKHIGVEIARSGKVVLDVGNAAGSWLMANGFEKKLDLIQDKSLW